MQIIGKTTPPHNDIQPPAYKLKKPTPWYTIESSRIVRSCSNMNMNGFQ